MTISNDPETLGFGIPIPLEPGLFDHFDWQVREFVLDPMEIVNIYAKILRKIVDEGRIAPTTIRIPSLPTKLDVTGKQIRDELLTQEGE